MKRKNKAYENGGKGEILPGANIIKIALLLIIATIFFVAPLYAENKTLQINTRQQKNISKSVTKITPAKSFAPLVPRIKVSSPAIKTISPSFPKLNNHIAVIPNAKINNFKKTVPLVPLVPKLNSVAPRALKINPAPVLKLTVPKINTIAPTLKQPAALNFKQAQAFKLIPKQYYPVKLPKSGPIPVVPSRQKQPILPVLPPVSNNPVGQAAGSNTGNTNSNNSGHQHGASGAPFTTAPLILGLFGHFPALSKRRMSKIISEISRRLKNGIGIIFGARSPNISQVDACNLAYVHQQGQEEILGNKLGWSQENCGLFCLFGAKKTL
jgi:hypothetical protein